MSTKDEKAIAWLHDLECKGDDGIWWESEDQSAEWLIVIEIGDDGLFQWGLYREGVDDPRVASGHKDTLAKARAAAIKAWHELNEARS